MKARHVFINCPFSADYQDHFRAIVFAVVRNGFKPRCALERDDGAENRFDKICEIIGECRLGIHDISKTELDETTQLPRFNMPLELGLFLGAKKFGGTAQRRKRCIIFDRDPYRYQAFMSDIAGQDIHAHGGTVSALITRLSAWLRIEARGRVPGGHVIAEDFAAFLQNLPGICTRRRLVLHEISYGDYVSIATEWIALQR